jgi:GNAT superfamily N-acetyltransferase
MLGEAREAGSLPRFHFSTRRRRPRCRRTPFESVSGAARRGKDRFARRGSVEILSELPPAASPVALGRVDASEPGVGLREARRADGGRDSGGGAGKRVGCVFCVAADATTAQLRILLVDPFARGYHVGGRLVDACISFARRAGYERMRAVDEKSAWPRPARSILRADSRSRQTPIRVLVPS